MSDIDVQIRGLFDKLNARKNKAAELKASAAKSWKTTGTFRQIGATSTTNLQTANEDQILEIATQIELLSGASNTAATKLGLTASAKVQSYTLEDWYHDLNKRLSAINLREEEAAVAQLETRLNQVLSPEERRRIEVELLLKEV